MFVKKFVFVYVRSYGIFVINRPKYFFTRMKFQKELSPERVSLLSPEDRKIYEQERRMMTQTPILDNYVVFDDIDETAIVKEELRTVYDEYVYDVVSRQEYQKFLAENKDIIFSRMTQRAVNEGAEGDDTMAWTRDLHLGWLGALAAAGLTGLGTGIAALIVAGKDKLAMIRLKKYMNRLVEVIDQGIHKKRGWLSSLFTKKKRNYMGERNLACLRSVQEMADRNMTTSVMDAAHKLGFFGQGNMMQITSGGTPQSGGGLSAFQKNCLSKFNIVLDKKPVKNVNAKYDDDKRNLDTY